MGVENFYADTAMLELYNPKKARFSYSIFVGNKFHSYGAAIGDTVIKVHSPKGRTVSIIGTYTWRGAAHPLRYDIYKLDKELHVELRKKDLVFPGQRELCGGSHRLSSMRTEDAGVVAARRSRKAHLR